MDGNHDKNKETLEHTKKLAHSLRVPVISDPIAEPHHNEVLEGFLIAYILPYAAAYFTPNTDENYKKLNHIPVLIKTMRYWDMCVLISYLCRVPRWDDHAETSSNSTTTTTVDRALPRATFDWDQDYIDVLQALRKPSGIPPLHPSVIPSFPAYVPSSSSSSSSSPQSSQDTDVAGESKAKRRRV